MSKEKRELTFAERQRLVEDILRRKVVSHSEELSPAQQEELQNTQRSLMRKITTSLTKFALSSVQQCRIM